MKFLNKTIVCIGLLVGLASCERDEINNLDIEVYTNKKVYSPNEMVTFNFTNTSDLMTFYSGEPGKIYKYKDRVELEGGRLEASMTTWVRYGTQQQNINFLVSSDFSGEYTKEGIESATWDNYTSFVQWPTIDAVQTPSGLIDLTSSLRPGKPIYFAYRYIGLAAPTAQQRTWRIYEFDVKNRFSETDVATVATRSTAGWRAVTVNDPGNKGVWFLTDATMIYYNPESNLQPVEKWVISKKFEPNKVTPDVGEPIKKYADNPMYSYNYSFSQPGEYEVTFVFSNVNYSGSKEIVKTVKVIVE